MAAVSPFLFSWNDVEARSDLDRFYLVRDNLPDENIVTALEKRRGNGRDDFPICAMWNALIAGIVFQHVSIESLIRELSRNPALLGACGFDILPRHKKPVAELRRNEDTGRMEIICSFGILDKRGHNPIFYGHIAPSGLARTFFRRPGGPKIRQKGLQRKSLF